MTPPWTLSGLRIYPVKSCGGIPVEEAVLTSRGLAWDREWMVVGADGTFVTQRQQPRLALVRVALEPGELVLRAAGMEACRLPLEVAARREREITVWRHRGPAWDEGEVPARWLTAYLGIPAALVRFIPTERRLSSLEWTGGLEAENRFSDGFPLLVTLEESLADLNRRLGGAPLPMDRFRPNLIFAGGEAYAEDAVRTLAVAGIELRLVKPCARCPITTTDQATGEVGVEPLRTLAGYRRDGRVGGVTFGQNAVVACGVGGRLRVGMEFRAVR